MCASSHEKSRNEAAYDQWAPTYDSDPNPHKVLEEDDVVRLVAVRAGERILDAACGTGRYSSHFSKAGGRVTGIDVSQGMLDLARKKVPEAEFLKHDLALPLPFGDGLFDTICCAQALKHLQDLSQPFREFSRVLKPGGRLVFSVTHPEMDWTDYELRHDTAFTLSEQSDIFHHKFFQYMAWSESAGLDLSGFTQLPVGEKIRHLLTESSFARVRGRFQIAVFTLTKRGAAAGSLQRPPVERAHADREHHEDVSERPVDHRRARHGHG
jgi:ubiquinone/menaquinone biosynthesis C-methylase UbiE